MERTQSMRYRHALIALVVSLFSVGTLSCRSHGVQREKDLEQLEQRLLAAKPYSAELHMILAELGESGQAGEEAARRVLRQRLEGGETDFLQPYLGLYKITVREDEYVSDVLVRIARDTCIAVDIDVELVQLLETQSREHRDSKATPQCRVLPMTNLAVDALRVDKFLELLSRTHMPWLKTTYDRGRVRVVVWE